MESIVPIAELRNHISQVLEEIRFGVAAQRDSGLIVDMPEEVTFQCEVIFDFQSLEVRRTTVANDAATEVGDTTREGTGTQVQNTKHIQTDFTEGIQKKTQGADA
jgi:hypothetical protein